MNQFQQECSDIERQWNTTLDSWRDEKSRKFESNYWALIQQCITAVLAALQDASNAIEQSKMEIQ